MPRFVLLYHDCPPTYPRPSHWDLMLESGDMLRTWALEKLPHDWREAQTRTLNKYPHCPVPADHNEIGVEQLDDHRQDYLGFEGELSRNRGSVIRIFAGTYETTADSPAYIEILITENGNSWQLRFRRANGESSSWMLELQNRT